MLISLAYEQVIDSAVELGLEGWIGHGNHLIVREGSFIPETCVNREERYSGIDSLI